MPPLNESSEVTPAQQFRSEFFADDWPSQCGWRGYEFPAREFSVIDYGAPSDGVRLATSFIQAALDACMAAGGGVVRVPKGDYLVGSLNVGSNTHLILDAGATLLASMNLEDYTVAKTRVAGIEIDWPLGVLNIRDSRNVRLSGQGRVHGRGYPFWVQFWHMKPIYEAAGLRWAVDYDCRRPRMLVVSDSQNVHIGDITLMESAFWTVQIVFSRHITVDGITIENNREDAHGPSSDGIDVDSSEYVRVQNCDIDCNDDNLCLKAGRDAQGLEINRPCRYVVIRDNRTRRGAAVVTFGSETSGGIEYVLVQNLRAKGTSRGIRFKSARTRGGYIRNILLENLKIEDTPFAFEFTMDWNPEYSYCVLPDEWKERGIPEHWKVLTAPVEPPERGICKLERVLIADSQVTGKCWKCFNVEGFPEAPISDFLFERVEVHTETAGEIKHALRWKAVDSLFRFSDASAPSLQDTMHMDEAITGPAD